MFPELLHGFLCPLLVELHCVQMPSWSHCPDDSMRKGTASSTYKNNAKVETFLDRKFKAPSRETNVNLTAQIILELEWIENTYTFVTGRWTRQKISNSVLWPLIKPLVRVELPLLGNLELWTFPPFLLLLNVYSRWFPHEAQTDKSTFELQNKTRFYGKCLAVKWDRNHKHKWRNKTN